MIFSVKFLDAVAHTLGHEGGFVNDLDDPGGATKFGISKRQFPDLDVRSLTREKALQIYFKYYWKKFGYDKIIDDSLSGKIFDLSVNMGPKNAHKCAQRACHANHQKIAIDGILGNITIAALNSLPPLCVLVSLRSEAAGYYRRLVCRRAAFEKFLKGWLSRAYF